MLLTGATGFIGGSLLRQCLADGYDVAVYARRPAPTFLNSRIPWYVGSFGNVPQLMHAIQGFNPDWILHCAGAGSVPFSLASPAEDFNNSASLVQNLLEAVRLGQTASRIALMSSAALYGNPTSLPISEDAAVQPLSPYGWNRSIAEQLFESYSRSYGIHGYVARIFSAYGEHLRKQVIYDAFIKTAWATEEECVFFGTGEETRDFIHAADLSKAVLQLCAGEARGLFNIASGVQTTIKELVELVVRTHKRPIRIRFNGEHRPGDPLYWQADISRLESMGFTPSVSLREGIERVWNWVRHERPLQ
jgi:UDP-glucose 4-epimerase